MPLVLVADDDLLLCDLIAFVLEGEGHAVRVANDGQSALQLATAEQPDVVILDCMMPVMTGLEVLRELRASAASAAMPVIVLSARKADADVAEAMRAGATDYLTKPFLPEELTARVASLITARYG